MCWLLLWPLVSISKLNAMASISLPYATIKNGFWLVERIQSHFITLFSLQEQALTFFCCLFSKSLNARLSSFVWCGALFSTGLINLDEKCKLLWTILKFIKIVCHKNMWVFSLFLSLIRSVRSLTAARHSGWGMLHAGSKTSFFFFRFFFDGRVHVLVACWRRRGRRLPSLFYQNEFLIVIYLVPFRCGNNMTCCSHVLSLRRHRFHCFFLFPPTVPFRVLSTSRALPAPAHMHKLRKWIMNMR